MALLLQRQTTNDAMKNSDDFQVVPLPITTQTLLLTLGGIAQKPGVVDGRIAIREYLDLTISFDHDIIDGAPAARFTRRLKELVEGSYGLDDISAG